MEGAGSTQPNHDITLYPGHLVNSNEYSNDIGKVALQIPGDVASDSERKQSRPQVQGTDIDTPMSQSYMKALP